MNIKKDDYEIAILSAFSAGLSAGYGIDHTNVLLEEEIAIRKFAEARGFKRKSLPK